MPLIPSQILVAHRNLYCLCSDFVFPESMELLFSKRDLKDQTARAAFAKISGSRDDLISLGRALLDTALTLKTAAVKQWFDESVAMFSGNLPSRVVNNLSGCMAGLRLLEAACNRLGLAWSQVFSISLDGCAKYMEYAAREYLLDGGNSNKSIVETTLGIIQIRLVFGSRKAK